jgi:hypothetical protein
MKVPQIIQNTIFLWSFRDGNEVITAPRFSGTLDIIAREEVLLVSHGLELKVVSTWIFEEKCPLEGCTDGTC